MLISNGMQQAAEAWFLSLQYPDGPGELATQDLKINSVAGENRW